MATKNPNIHLVKSESRTVDRDAPALVKEVTIEFKDEKYTVRGDSLDNLDVMEALEDEKYITVIRSVLGKEQWTRYKDSIRTADGRAPMTGDFESFIEKVFSALDPTGGSRGSQS